MPPRRFNPPGDSFTTDIPNETFSFDIDAFDQAIRSQGVTLVHYRAMKCPVGMIDQYDQRKPHDDHAGCSNGFLYVYAGEMTCLFVSNSTSTRSNDTGLLDGSTVQITCPRYYDNSETEIRLAPWDRIFLKQGNVPVINWQLFEYNQSGVNKMQYPVLEVEHLVDANNVVYKSPSDFEVIEGLIKWRGNTPGINLENNKGLVCSIRYSYLPFWYVKNLLHEVRVTQSEDMLGNRQVQRMPFSAMLQREYVFELENKDPQAPNPNSARQVKAPASNGFGAR